MSRTPSSRALFISTNRRLVLIEGTLSDHLNQNSTGGITRRDLLRAGAAGLLLGSGLLLIPKRYFRMPQEAQTFVTKVAHYQLDIADAIVRGVRELGVFPEDLKGKRILLKPN